MKIDWLTVKWSRLVSWMNSDQFIWMSESLSVEMLLIWISSVIDALLNVYGMKWPQWNSLILSAFQRFHATNSNWWYCVVLIVTLDFETGFDLFGYGIRLVPHRRNSGAGLLLNLPEPTRKFECWQITWGKLELSIHQSEILNQSNWNWSSQWNGFFLIDWIWMWCFQVLISELTWLLGIFQFDWNEFFVFSLAGNSGD